jgi:hypothetical protein
MHIRTNRRRKEKSEAIKEYVYPIGAALVKIAKLQTGEATKTHIGDPLCDQVPDTTHKNGGFHSWPTNHSNSRL